MEEAKRKKKTRFGRDVEELNENARAVGVVKTVGEAVRVRRTLGSTNRNDRVGPGLSKIPDARFCLGLAGSLKIEMTSGYKQLEREAKKQLK